MDEEIKYNVQFDRSEDGRIMWLRFSSDSKLNIFTMGMIREIHSRITELALAKDKWPRVLVISGKPDMFSGGADMKPIRENDEDHYQSYVKLEYEAFRTIERLPFVIMASIGGYCLGNAAEMALACDLRISTASSKISFAESTIGFMAPAQRLSKYVGIGRAKEILYSGRFIDTKEAESLGLITRVVPDEALETATQAFAEEYADMAPIALRLTKENIDAAYGLGAHRSLEIDGAFESYKTEDRIEGLNALFERRNPKFKGR